MATHVRFRGLSMKLLVFCTLMSPVLSFAAEEAKGKTLYGTLCASCHGPSGAGDGPVAAALPPEAKPASLVTGKYKFVKDEATFIDLMRKGGGAVGLSAMMPPQPSISDDDIKSLWIFMNSIKKS